MNQLNNLFQIGIVMLVTAMALTIPNLRKHSIIGNYHTSSMALNANAHYKIHPLSEEKPIILLELMAGPLIAAAVVAATIEAFQLAAVGLAAEVIGLAAIVAAAGIDIQKENHLSGDSSLISNYKNHVAHDFSKFDN